MNAAGPRMVDVEQLLRRASTALAYPPTPSIAAGVAARLRAPQAPPRRRPLLPLSAAWRRPALGLAAVVAAVLLAVGVALAVPQSRTALAEFFGLSHVRVEVREPLGPPAPVLSPESFARPAGLAEAQQAVDFPVRLPTLAGSRRYPDAVYVRGAESDLPTVIFVYEDEGYDLYQTRAGFFGKEAPDPALVHEITFGGRDAYWIDQGGHIASFLDEQGRVVVETRRTVERATLLWEEEGVTYRLEASLTQEEAIRIAGSLQ